MKYTRKPIEPAPSAPLWYVTFSDMMTLLLACFVLLLSFSTVSKTQFGSASRSLSGALGAWQGNPEAIDSRRNESKEAGALHNAARELRRLLQIEGRAADVGIEYEGKALKLVLSADALFGRDSASLQPAAAPLLGMIDSLIAEVPRAAVLFSGHEDGSSLTAPERYADNVGTSYTMAEMVYAALRGLPGGIDAHRPVVEGSGDARPVATAATDEGRRKNRRVEILIRTETPPEAAS